MRTCKKSFIILLIFCWTNVTLALSATQNLVQRLSNIRTMQAKFTQVMVRSPKSKQTLKGTVALQRPGRFRWQVVKPQPQLLLADGQYVWFYEPLLKQATRQDLNNQPVNSPAMLLTGSITNLKRIFQVSYLAKDAKSTAFLLRPRAKDSFFQSITLTFSNGQLKAMTMVDNLGQKSDYWFSRVRQNINIPAATFRFVPPSGVDVIS